MTEDGWWHLIESSRRDFALLLGLADWLEERQDPRAEAARWAGRAGKWPFDWARDKPEWGFDTIDWTYGTMAWDVPSWCVLPEQVWNALDGYVRINETARQWKEYEAHADALRDLLGAYRKARAAGWRPDG